MASDFLAAVVECSRRLTPPLTLGRSTATGSFDDGSVELIDGHVVWWIVRERSVLRLEAAPEWDPDVTFDADLLKRFLGHEIRTGPSGASGSAETLREMITRPLEDVMMDLEQLRQPIAAAFNQPTWETTRRELLDVGRRRDAELFGRPSHAPDR